MLYKYKLPSALTLIEGVKYFWSSFILSTFIVELQIWIRDSYLFSEPQIVDNLYINK